VNTDKKRQAVFLDRDGVLNEAIIVNGKPYPPEGLSDVHILPGVREGLHALHSAGFILVVITNQPDVSRGRVTRESVYAINNFLMDELPLDNMKVCFHDNADHCDCRKPKPGNIIKAAQELGIDLNHSFMVGDRWSDIEAGRRAGCKTVFIENLYVEKNPESPDFQAKEFYQVVKCILNTRKESTKPI